MKHVFLRSRADGDACLVLTRYLFIAVDFIETIQYMAELIGLREPGYGDKYRLGVFVVAFCAGRRDAVRRGRVYR